MSGPSLGILNCGGRLDQTRADLSRRKTDRVRLASTLSTRADSSRAEQWADQNWLSQTRTKPIRTWDGCGRTESGVEDSSRQDEGVGTRGNIERSWDGKGRAGSEPAAGTSRLVSARCADRTQRAPVALPPPARCQPAACSLSPLSLPATALPTAAGPARPSADASAVVLRTAVLGRGFWMWDRAEVEGSGVAKRVAIILFAVQVYTGEATELTSCNYVRGKIICIRNTAKSLIVIWGIYIFSFHFPGKLSDIRHRYIGFAL